MLILGLTFSLSFVMTLGYPMGAKVRNFSIREVLRITHNHWKK